MSNADLIALRVRVIALENLLISLLATASDQQLDLAREMAGYISPRPGFSDHPLTVHAAATLQAEGKLTRPGGLTIGGALGIQWLAAEQDIYSELRPTLQIALSQKLAGGIELRGSFTAAYESSDTDDPLASYVRRLELEAKARLRRDLSLGAGVYLERKRNLLLGYDERDRGVYAEVTYRLGPASDMVLRVDYSRDALTGLDLSKDTLEAYLGVTRRL